MALNEPEPEALRKLVAPPSLVLTRVYYPCPHHIIIPFLKPHDPDQSPSRQNYNRLTNSTTNSVNSPLKVTIHIWICYHLSASSIFCILPIYFTYKTIAIHTFIALIHENAHNLFSSILKQSHVSIISWSVTHKTSNSPLLVGQQICVPDGDSQANASVSRFLLIVLYRFLKTFSFTFISNLQHPNRWLKLSKYYDGHVPGRACICGAAKTYKAQSCPV